MVKPIKSVAGQVFGYVTATEDWERRGNYIYCKCVCICGKELWIYKSILKYTKSCGCQKTYHIKHGHTQKTSNNVILSPTYRSWLCMKQRCLNPKSTGYENYGGRGITLSEEWRTFDNFLKDMGERPSADHSIDRIDNSQGYHAGNCKWSTRKEQNNNRRPRRERAIG